MRIIYNFCLKSYYFLILFASLFNYKAKLWIAGRKKIFENLKKIDFDSYKTIWVHCSSLGEFEQGRPLIDKIKTNHAEYKILLTFFSPSGYEIRKNYINADFIFYLPLDNRKTAKYLIETVNPKYVFFVKYEHWYYYLKNLKKLNIPTYLISANFRINQVFFKSYGKWYLNLLNCYTTIFVQNEKSKLLLENHGIKNVLLAGDTRFDRVYENTLNSKSFDFIEKFKNNTKLIIAGSTWPNDEDLIINYINNHPNYKYIIAPHNVTESNINNIIKKLNCKYCLFSEANQLKLEEYRLIIVNNVGNLSSLYKYSDLAYIGGGFNNGIHNILEALAFGNPVIFGPKFQKFNEAIESINLNIGFSIKNYFEFEKVLNITIENSEYFKIKNSAINYIKNNLGSTNIILNNTLNKS